MVKSLRYSRVHNLNIPVYIGIEKEHIAYIITPKFISGSYHPFQSESNTSDHRKYYLHQTCQLRFFKKIYLLNTVSRLSSVDGICCLKMKLKTIPRIVIKTIGLVKTRIITWHNARPRECWVPGWPSRHLWISNSRNPIGFRKATDIGAIKYR